VPNFLEYFAGTVSFFAFLFYCYCKKYENFLNNIKFWYKFPEDSELTN